MEHEQIYLDYAAATPLDDRVLTVMLPYFSDKFFNPSSPYKPALDVRHEYEAAKSSIARIIGATAGELTMTAGATESINLAFHGRAGHVVTTSIEHPAVLEVVKTIPHTIIGVDVYGRVSLDELRAAIRDETELVSVGLANNEIGTIQSMSEIAAMISQIRKSRLEKGNATPLLLHSDASQGLGLLDVNVGRLGVDLLTLNAGKVYGPKQVGLLFIARHVTMQPAILGGGQESGMRSGTENVSGVIGFAKALEIADTMRKSEVERIRKLRDEAEHNLMKLFPQAVVSGHRKHRLANYLHISFPNVDAERLVFLLEAQNIFVATGSACAANKGTRSHVLTAIGLADEVADGSLRITLGRSSDETALERAVQAIAKCVQAEYERMTR